MCMCNLLDRIKSAPAIIFVQYTVRCVLDDDDGDEKDQHRKRERVVAKITPYNLNFKTLGINLVSN